LPVAEDEALQSNPTFWKMIDAPPKAPSPERPAE
jgi:hypothetical protein